jgi:hypothetical protein
MSSPTSNLMQTSISHHGKGGGSEPLLRPFEWHELVRGLVSTAEENLWSSSGTKARAFLLKQGLREDTIRAVRLGYWPKDERIGGVYDDAPILDPARHPDPVVRRTGC